MTPMDEELSPLERRVDQLLHEMAAAADSIEWSLRSSDVAPAAVPRSWSRSRTRVAVIVLTASIAAVLVIPLMHLHVFGPATKRTGATNGTSRIAACRSGNLSLSVAQFGVTATSSFFLLEVSNHASAAPECRITGLPHVTSGVERLPTSWSTQVDGLHFAAERSVVLRPGARAWFDVVFYACGPKPCASVTGFKLVLPDGSGSVAAEQVGVSTDRLVVSPFQGSDPPAPPQCRLGGMRIAGLATSPGWFGSTGGGGRLLITNESSAACRLTTTEIGFSFRDASGAIVPAPSRVPPVLSVIMESRSTQAPQFLYQPGSCAGSTAGRGVGCYSVTRLVFRLGGSSTQLPLHLRARSGPTLVDYSLGVIREARS